MALKTGAQVTVIRLPMVSSVFELTLLAACLFTRGQSWSRLRRLCDLLKQLKLGTQVLMVENVVVDAEWFGKL
jgi:hypothetical protein